ncbi:unnamed protein product [Cunninghamella blakesleeana]
MMFIKALGLSIFTLATLTTAQGPLSVAVIQWGSKSQYVIPGNDIIVAVEGNKVTAKLSNVATGFLISNDSSGSSGNIAVASNKVEKQCWQVNDSTMLVEIAPCLSGNEKQPFLVKVVGQI